MKDKTNEELLKEVQKLKQENMSLRKLYQKDVSELKKAEKALIESEERFQLLFNNAPLGYQSLDIDGNFIEVNQQWFDTLGYTRDEVIGKWFGDFLSPDYQDGFRKRFPIFKEQGKIHSEFEMVHKNGNILFIAFEGRIGYETNGEFKQTHCILQDITKNKKLENNLRKSEVLFKSMVENLNAVTILIDEKGVAIYISQQCEKVLGYPDNRFIGKSFPDIIHPDDIAKYQQEWEQVLLHGKGLHEFEYRIIDGQGDVRWVSHNALMVKTDEQVIGMQNTIRNITDQKLAEEKHKNSENYLRETQIIANLGTYTMDVKSGKWTSSEILDKIFGIDSDYDKSVESWASIIHPEWQKIMTDYFINEVIGNKTKFDKEYKIVRKNDKAERWVHGIGNLKIDENDQPIELIGTIQDITERKFAELGLIAAKEKTEENEEKFRNLFEHSPIGKSMTGIDGSMHVNKAFCDIVGYSEKELGEKNLVDITHPEDVLQTNEVIQSLINGEIEKASIEKRYIHKNGNTIWVDLTTYLQRDKEKKPQFFITTVIDITQRKEAESKLRGLATIIEHSLNEIYIFRQEDLKFTYVNSGALRNIGFSKEEMLTKSPVDIKPDVTPDSFLKKINPLLTHEQDIINFETIHQRKDGTTYPVDVYLQLGKFEGKEVFVAMITDVTERKIYESDLIKAKEKAEESDRLKSAFLANMSHEIRTPMNGILGFTELLREPNLSSDDQQDFIQTIQISGERMLNTINNIVNVSKIESGLINVTIDETNINRKIEFAYKFFKPEVERKGLQFICKNGLQTENAVIRTDNEKVYGVLTNLIKNAIKFTYDGSIEFGYEKKGAFLEFYVKDTGVGIPKNQREFIFERFRQGSNELNRLYEGSGLGLAIAKSYIEMLDGKIWVESEEGKGSTFYFTIPFHSVEEEKTEKTEIKDIDSEEIKKVQTKNLKILIVEDDEVSYSLLKRTIQKIGKEVLHAITGVQAIEACRSNPDLDLVLMDIRMPIMDGNEATRQIRQFNKDVIIIAQTAYAFAGDSEKAIEAGCNDYITKPINMTTLFELIKKHVNK